MGLAAPISSALNTLSLGALGHRDPEPVVLRDAGDGSYVRQYGTSADADYGRTKWLGVGMASASWVGVMGAAEGVSRGIGIKGSAGIMGVRAVQWSAGIALTLGAALVAFGGLESDKVKLVYEDANGNAKVGTDGEPVTRTISRAEYEQGVTRPS